ncbi:MAG: flagellar basal body-associated FliL family protein [Rhodospirillales bacterium]|jgi:flagellar basal body-associated protein FliL|nr:flagellar basal body-associated FliL family protein [Rhodospirillales bacterium]
MGETSGGKDKKAKTPKKKSKTSKIILIIAVVTLLIAAILGGSYYLGIIHTIMGWEKANSHAEIAIGKPVFIALPEIKTDLKTNECRSPFLRAVIHVQLSPEDVHRLEEVQPQVMDAILTHLRGQERQSLVGKDGSERLRFEIVQIIENIIKPAKVHTILFKDLIVQ